MSEETSTDALPQDDDNGARRARLRWLGAVLWVVMLGMLAWQAMEVAPEPHPREQAAVQDLPAGDVERAAVPLDAGQTRAATSASQPLAADAGLDAPVTALAADEIEVCGLGRVKTDAAGRPLDTAPMHSAVRHAREQVVPLLLGSQDDVSRAAGLFWVALGEASAREEGTIDVSGARDELATLASLRGSPQIYAWAMRACQQHRGEGACGQLSADQWARVEPSNAMAWLQVAADARVRGDEAAVAEAMYRVTHATRSDAGQGALLSAVLAKLPAEVELLPRVGLANELAKLDSRAELPLLAASQHCGVNEVRDANRQQVCASVANVLARRGGTMAEMALGASIGERAGWPAERVAAASEERDALAYLAAGSTTAEAWSCDAMAKALMRIHDAARQGEMGALRAALKRSPDNAAGLARRYREANASRVAASAAAPASEAASAMPP